MRRWDKRQTPLFVWVAFFIHKAQRILVVWKPSVDKTALERKSFKENEKNPKFFHVFREGIGISNKASFERHIVCAVHEESKDELQSLGAGKNFSSSGR